MGVYIAGMEMPKSCCECRFCNGQADTDYGVCAWCDVDGKARDAYTRQNCPLVPVPPHGRLIDSDAVVAEIDSYIDNMAYSYSYLLREEQSQREHGMVFARDIVCDAPTIIPAEEGET